MLLFRFAIAGAFLLAALGVRRVSLLPARGERVRVFLLGAIGYMVESTLFFMGLERGTAAAVSLLFYTYPAMVTLLEIALGWAPLQARSLAALGLSAGGSVLVVVAGGDVSISTAGVVLSLASAAAITVYLVVSNRLVVRTDSMTTGAWMAIGAATAFGVRALIAGGIDAPGSAAPRLVANGVATSFAFGLLFAAMKRLGPTRTSVVMTLEAFFAIVLAAAFLDEGVRPLQALGGVAILVATALVAMSRPSRTAAPT